MSSLMKISAYITFTTVSFLGKKTTIRQKDVCRVMYVESFNGKQSVLSTDSATMNRPGFTGVVFM